MTLFLLLGLVLAANPLYAVCGDTTTDSGEQCDDGNTTDGDGCSSTCQVECGFLQSGLINGSFEFPQQAPNTNTEHDETLVPAWFTSREDFSGPVIEIFGESTAVPAKHGNNYASLNIVRRTGVYQYVDVVPGVKIDWSVWHRAEVLASEEIRVRINGTSQGISAAGLTAWTEFAGQYTVPQGVYRITFQVEGFTPTTSDQGNFVDDISISYPDIPSVADCTTTPTILHQSHQTGRIVVIGNTNMSCDESDPDCTNARNFTGSKIENNDFDMKTVDVDSAGFTPNSSWARLTLNPGETVTWSGLVWSAGYTDFGKPNIYTPPANTNTGHINFRRNVSGGNLTSGVNGVVSDLEGRIFRTYADTTTIADRAAAYWIRNIKATQGPGMFAGWAMVFVTHDPNLPMRSMTVAELPLLRNTDRLRFTVPNFSNAYDPGAAMEFGYVGWDGDAGVTDFIFLNGNLLQPSASSLPNDAWDVSNSTVSQLGATINRNPSHPNTFGTDVKTFDGTNFLFGSTDIDVEYVTPGDHTVTGLVTFQTDIPTPGMSPLTIPEDIASPNPANNIDFAEEIAGFSDFSCATGGSATTTWLLAGVFLIGVRRRKKQR